MERAAAALGVDGNHDSRVAAVFGVECTGLDLELTDSVETDLCVLTVVGPQIRIDRAIQKYVVGAPAHAIDVELVRIVENEPKVAGIICDDSRQRAHERHKIAPVE